LFIDFGEKMDSIIEKRKKDHLELCASKDVSFKQKTTLFECVELNYKALPEVNLNKVNLETNFLGKKFSFPFLVSAITGGTQASRKVNEEIAIACQETGIGMGLGSMRAMLKHPSLTETYYIRDKAPDIFLAGNIGAVQLQEYKIEEIESALQAIEANALAVHINAAQESIQPEGDTNFEGCIAKITELADKLSIPVYVKEVGHGISYEVALALKETKIKAIDVQGAGGTSWTRVDALRHQKSFGLIFSEFGIPTAASLIETKQALHGTGKKIIASGGIRTGIDAAKAIVLGADMIGNALPILKTQQKKGAKGIVDYLNLLKKEMDITSFLLGCENIHELQKEKPIILGTLKEWIEK
jgi:isopentenyl-diphosphate delta-isomerase